MGVGWGEIVGCSQLFELSMKAGLEYFARLVKLSEIICCGSLSGVKLQNEIFHEPGTSPDQPLVPTHPIIWLELFVGSPGKQVAMPRAMNS